ncbi:hypothetical protein [Catellatospora paridis]|uniref:hypothetical protein n=1 Tax=Catellatospora paridis TaxID=1617086 RepID=UPI0012D4A8F1|nr:hypothetical protein [Catellatospora paridis]
MSDPTDGAGWTPPQPPACACPEHIEDILDVVIASRYADPPSMTVREVLDTGDLSVLPLEQRWLGGSDGGPLHWDLWVGDAARCLYKDNAQLALDDSLIARPGIDRVEWTDREILLLGAPRLCASGVLAAAARALEDPRVR